MTEETKQKKNSVWGWILAGGFAVLTGIFLFLWIKTAGQPAPDAKQPIVVKISFPPKHASDWVYIDQSGNTNPGQEQNPISDTTFPVKDSQTVKDSKIAYLHLDGLSGRVYTGWIDSTGMMHDAIYPFRSTPYGFHFELEHGQPSYTFYDFTTKNERQKWWGVELEITGGSTWSAPNDSLVNSPMVKTAARFVIPIYGLRRTPFLEIIPIELGGFFPLSKSPIHGYVSTGIRFCL